MGLDAIVFRNVNRLEEQFGSELFDADDTTGEATIKPGVQVAVPREAYVANAKRLGNLAEITALQYVVSDLLGNESLIMQRVLYSASHSGDWLELNMIPALSRKISLLKARNVQELSSFLQALESLTASALAEHNPIVFV